MDGDTALKEVHRDHEKALLGVRSDYDAFHVGERPTRDAHPLALPEIRVGKDREAGVDEFLNGLDFGIGNGVESVPALPEYAHQPARLVRLEIARLVHHVAQEEVSPEERDARETSDSATSAPRLDGGEEHVKDRKSTRLNSSHVRISYAVFCLKKKKSCMSASKLTVYVANTISLD